jgi:hypothetical protein
MVCQGILDIDRMFMGMSIMHKLLYNNNCCHGNIVKGFSASWCDADSECVMHKWIGILYALV